LASPFQPYQGTENFAVFAISGRILHLHIHKVKSKFFGNLAIVEGHFVTDAAVFGRKFNEGWVHGQRLNLIQEFHPHATSSPSWFPSG
jgi:hypothetical protein